MACEEYLEQMETAAIAMDEIDAEILQLQYQRQAQEGILIGSYMLYMGCLANQNNGRQAQPKRPVSITVSEIVAWTKKTVAKIRRRKKLKVVK